MLAPVKGTEDDYFWKEHQLLYSLPLGYVRLKTRNYDGPQRKLIAGRGASGGVPYNKLIGVPELLPYCQL